MEFSVTSDTCRICLENNPNCCLLSDSYKGNIPQFKGNSNLETFMDVYKFVAGIKDPVAAPESSVTDFFPKRVCNDCTVKLATALEFRRKALRSEDVLKNLIELYDDRELDNTEIVDDIDESETANDEFLDEIDVGEYKVEKIEYVQEPTTLVENDKSIANKSESSPELSSAGSSNKSKSIKFTGKKVSWPTAWVNAAKKKQAEKKDILWRGNPLTTQCEDCGKMIISRNLKAHMVSHKSIDTPKPYSCNICNSTFTVRKNLNNHKRIHSNDKRYTCSYCNMKFLHWGSRRYHIARCHTGEKKHVCEICGAGFRNSSQCIIHYRRHTGSTPFACDQCDRQFVYKQSLKFHQLSHTDAKNFHCDVCGKSYKSRKSLRIHVRTLHELEKNYVCPICNLAFSQNHVLRTHLLKNHPDYEPPPPGTIVSVKGLERLKKLAEIVPDAVAHKMEFSVTSGTCRICLENNPNCCSLSDPYRGNIPQFKGNPNLETFMDVYKFVAGIEDPVAAPTSSVTEFFPRRICKDCTVKLAAALEFRRKALRSEDVLKNLIELYDDHDLDNVEIIDDIDESETFLDEEFIDEIEEEEYKVEEIEYVQEPTSYAEKDKVIAKKTENSQELVSAESSNKSKSIKFTDKVSWPKALINAAKYNQSEPKDILWRGNRLTTQCEDCGKIIVTRNWKMHMASHKSKVDRPRPYICNICNSTFTLKENLSKHKRIHSNDKRYTCSYCNKKFLHWASRRYHIDRCHTGEKKHVCEICGAGFCNSSQYILHSRRHTGSTPYACDQCDRKFVDGQSLKFHLLTHSDAKNFPCDVCGKSYKSRKSLRVHIRTLHDLEKNYVCPICSQAFSQNHVLRTHLLKNHPDYEPPPPGTIVSVKGLERLKKLAEMVPDAVVHDQ
ncbi:zinc finger protein 91-like [Armigeres subalbatus]|uniref:zinc finger protein 91-like n=1 Tax=Armigeres subalbatus TaxID=124917 RepID=UPI002ED1630E